LLQGASIHFPGRFFKKLMKCPLARSANSLAKGFFHFKGTARRHANTARSQIGSAEASACLMAKDIVDLFKVVEVNRPDRFGAGLYAKARVSS
jgi:hypothetical protein